MTVPIVASVRSMTVGLSVALVLRQSRQSGRSRMSPVMRAAVSGNFGGNSARLYNVSVKSALAPIATDRIAAITREYREHGGMRTNARYGYVHRARRAV